MELNDEERIDAKTTWIHQISEIVSSEIVEEEKTVTGSCIRVSVDIEIIAVLSEGTLFYKVRLVYGSRSIWKDGVIWYHWSSLIVAMIYTIRVSIL